MGKTETPKLSLKPNVSVAIIPIILRSLISGFIFVAVIGSLIFKKSISGMLLSGVFVFLIMVFLSYMNLRARKYLFYTDKAVFYEGFLNVVQRTVSYDRVTDIVMIRTVWDRLFGTGTIRLVTAGEFGRHMGAGLTLSYVENPRALHDKLESLMRDTKKKVR